MRNSNMIQLKRCLEESGRAKPGDIVGCSADEIATAESLLGIKFPPSYKDFLRVFGNVDSNVFPQEYLSLSLVLRKQDKATRMLMESDMSLPEGAFVYIIGDSQILFFDTHKAQEPAIFKFQEGSRNFQRVFDNFTTFINSYIQCEADVARKTGGYIHGEIISDPAQG